MAINLHNFSVAVPAPLSDAGLFLPGLANATTDLFGPNVHVFSPSQSISSIQQVVDQVFNASGDGFHGVHQALLFQAGNYSNLTFQVGFQTTVSGLGPLPDDTTISGGVDVFAPGTALNTFWRGIENMAVKPTGYNATSFFATSQACWLRRMHYYGDLDVYDSNSPGSIGGGSFFADSIIEGQVGAGDPNMGGGGNIYYITRNAQFSSWTGSDTNSVFVGDSQPPNGSYLQDGYSVVTNTPRIREKPYLVSLGNSSGNLQASDLAVMRPTLRMESRGPSWSTSSAGDASAIPLSKFYIAKADTDNSTTINLALQRGLNLIMTPGVYNLSAPIVVRTANTTVLGLGLPSLIPTGAHPAMIVEDVGGVSLAGLLFDAGTSASPNLLQWGGLPGESSIDHSANPSAMFDVHCRVGGVTTSAQTQSCTIVNVNDLILDNSWNWRADHGANKSYVGWEINPATTGFQVNSNGFTAYGLFVEHFKSYQTIFNGNNASVYFYQSEIPYDIPDQAAWTPTGNKTGFASYNVASNVTSHSVLGATVAMIAVTSPVKLSEAYSTPNTTGIKAAHLATVWGLSNNQSSIDSIINGFGAANPPMALPAGGLQAEMYIGTESA